MKTVALYTLGCKVNQYETQAMSELLEDAGYKIVPFDSKADAYVINTCTVTNTADKKSRQMISRAHSKNSKAVICVCGCLSQRVPDEILDLDGVSCVVGTAGRDNIVEYLNSSFEKKENHVDVLTEAFENLNITSSGIRTRANIKIQEGCNNFCSYCIIPYVRGRERSRDLDEILDEAARLSDAGVQEIVLSGIHVSSYRRSGKDLADVVQELNGIENIKRIRLGSLEQPDISRSFAEKLRSSDKLCPHFHISLQSGSNSVLKGMNRKYAAEEYLETLSLLREMYDMPAVTTDIIVGFPGESDADFEDTCDFVKRAGFSRLHVFPFSARKGTRAYDMPKKVPYSVKKERTARLIGIGKEAEHAYMDHFIGQEADVLFEQRSEDGCSIGYTDRYIKVSGQYEPGNIKKVLLKERVDDIIKSV